MRKDVNVGGWMFVPTPLAVGALSVCVRARRRRQEKGEPSHER